MTMARLKRLDYEKILVWILMILLFGFIGLINLSGVPDFYWTDMYCDMVYSTESWEQLSFFPDGWIFGNQLYLIATPNLAALFYGITSSPVLSMGLALTVMAILVVASFCWMISPVIPNWNDRLLTCALLVLIPFVIGDAIYTLNGWQLLFTLCSYYACYAITAFMTFGLYIRQFDSNEKHNLLLLIVVYLSFCTGIQSLRQTLIMVVPIAFIELIRIGVCRKRKRVPFRELLVSALIVFSNLAGVATARMLDIEQVRLFGKIGFANDLLAGIAGVRYNVWQLLCSNRFGKRFAIPSILVVLTFGIVRCIYLYAKKRKRQDVLLTSLLFLSVAGVVGVDALTTMNVRSIYYFMIYPLMAVCIIHVLKLPLLQCKYIRIPGLMAAILLFVQSASNMLPSAPHEMLSQKNDPYAVIVEDLQEEGITTVYSRWNLADKIAISSDMSMKAGFWDSLWQPFEEVRYLCNPTVFDSDNCAYIFKGTKEVEKAECVVAENGYQMQLFHYYPESDIYVFTSEYDLIDLID